MVTTYLLKHPDNNIRSSVIRTTINWSGSISIKEAETPEQQLIANKQMIFQLLMRNDFS
jgi:hypothetical protein